MSSAVRTSSSGSRGALTEQKMIPRRRSARYTWPFHQLLWRNSTTLRARRGSSCLTIAARRVRVKRKLGGNWNNTQPIRLHGTTRWYLHDYSRQELAAWAEKIRASGAKTAWIYFDNDRDAHSIKNARALRRMLSAKKRRVAAAGRRS